MLLVSSFVVVSIKQFAFQGIINGFSTNGVASEMRTLRRRCEKSCPRLLERLRGSYQVVTARGMDSRTIHFCG